MNAMAVRIKGVFFEMGGALNKQRRWRREKLVD